MKQLFLIVTAMFAVVSFPACSDPNDVCLGMDDIYFMDYCYAFFDVNKDGKVSRVEAEAVKRINFNDTDWKNNNHRSDIKSLKGIGYFVNLEDLNCLGISIAEIDLRQNKKLESATFYGCEYLQRIAISDGVTEIGNSAFRG